LGKRGSRIRYWDERNPVAAKSYLAIPTGVLQQP
jgi:hypothetical protein